MPRFDRWGQLIATKRMAVAGIAMSVAISVAGTVAYSRGARGVGHWLAVAGVSLLIYTVLSRLATRHNEKWAQAKDRVAAGVRVRRGNVVVRRVNIGARVLLTAFVGFLLASLVLRPVPKPLSLASFGALIIVFVLMGFSYRVVVTHP
jgi:hypothetical protein